MNTYRYDEIALGMSHEFKVTVSRDDKKAFENLSGDWNPLHVDETYAKNKGFQGEVIYGMLTASFLSRLVGMYLPGKYCLLQKMEITFVQPVYMDDELTVRGVVAKKYDSVRRIVIDCSIINQKKVQVCKAKVSVGCLE